MGERKGQNHYYPPDFDYKKHKSLNAYHGVHALRERASKIHLGILVIRFEMPFNIWCLGCHNHVGMGVRYNAEKKKIGMYYTTPLYEFRMKCHLCDNYFVIRTDPKNFDYELVEGCQRQEKRFDPSEVDGVAPIDRGHSLKLAADAMYKAEHQEDDRVKGTSDDKQIEKLEWIQERLRDDFVANSVLRRAFRTEKQHLNEERAADEDLKKRASLQIKLVPESTEDRRVASMLKRYANVKSFDDHQQEIRESINSRRIFSTHSPAVPGTSFGDSSMTTSASTSTAAADRIIATIRQQRGKQLNEKFEKGLKRDATSLGTVIGKKAKKETAHSSRSSTSSDCREEESMATKSRDLLEPKEEMEEEKKTTPPSSAAVPNTNPLAMLASYSSSDSGDSD